MLVRSSSGAAITVASALESARRALKLAESLAAGDWDAVRGTLDRTGEGGEVLGIFAGAVRTSADLHAVSTFLEGALSVPPPTPRAQPTARGGRRVSSAANPQWNATTHVGEHRRQAVSVVARGALPGSPRTVGVSSVELGAASPRSGAEAPAGDSGNDYSSTRELVVRLRDAVYRAQTLGSADRGIVAVLAAAGRLADLAESACSGDWKSVATAAAAVDASADVSSGSILVSEAPAELQSVLGRVNAEISRLARTAQCKVAIPNLLSNLSIAVCVA